MFTRWDELIGPDLQETYGLDDTDPTFWERPWRPVLHRIRGLLNHPDSRLARALTNR